MSQILNVYAAKQLVGVVTDTNHGMTFQYDTTYLQSANPLALSPELPLNTQLYAGHVVDAYFENLLPEGDVRRFIASAAEVSPENTFALLARFGGDTAGAISLLPPNELPSAEHQYLPVTPNDIKQWFDKTMGIPLHLKGEQAKMSLSGAQDKMTVYINDDGDISLPLGDAPSSHIIKPTVSHRRDIPNSAINEALIMRLAKAIKLDTAEVQYHPALDAVVVRRYDRVHGANGQLEKLHQNDLCQVLGISSLKKYESEGGPSLRACFDAVARISSQPALDKKRLIEWTVYNFLVGNHDGHAKNLSMVCNQVGQYKLSPHYDMLCTTVYPSLTEKFAFKIGGENRPRWLMNRHWDRFASDINVKPNFLTKIRKDIISKIEAELPKVTAELRQLLTRESDLQMVSRIEAAVLKSVELMKSRIELPATPSPAIQRIEIGSYASIKSPAQQAEFMKNLLTLLESKPEATAAYDFLKDKVVVGGEAFQLSKHLVSLEKHSMEWDLQDEPLNTKIHLFERAHLLKEAIPEYDAPSFIVGMESIADEVKQLHLEHEDELTHDYDFYPNV